jgi:hypothetical protein
LVWGDFKTCDWVRYKEGVMIFGTGIPLTKLGADL